ncbi:MAG: hypothetical protein GY852_09680, partial [bacterium]|nr:hypothetical protein [bacterium]
FWAGGDDVYLESTILAAGEPNPMRLIDRVITTVSVYYSHSEGISERVLLNPASEMALDGGMSNSFGGAALGAAILRRWQIPALVVPGNWSEEGYPGFLLATYVKPFGWMIISPYPRHFVALGSYDPPDSRGWFNGVAGISFQAEFLGSDSLWHAIPVNSPEFTHTVEIYSP